MAKQSTMEVDVFPRQIQGETSQRASVDERTPAITTWDVKALSQIVGQSTTVNLFSWISQPSTGC